MAISSTDCRRRIAAGKPVWYLVPDGVVQYIGKHRLYGATPRPLPPSPASDIGVAPDPDARSDHEFSTHEGVQ